MKMIIYDYTNKLLPVWIKTYHLTQAFAPLALPLSQLIKFFFFFFFNSNILLTSALKS